VTFEKIIPSSEFDSDEPKVHGFVFPLAPVLRGEGPGVRGNWSEVDTNDRCHALLEVLLIDETRRKIPG
jgi:hypothetical protein